MIPRYRSVDPEESESIKQRIQFVFPGFYFRDGCDFLSFQHLAVLLSSCIVLIRDIVQVRIKRIK